MKRIFIRLIFICAVLLGACDNPFTYSPFEVRLSPEFRNTTARNLEKIAQIDTSSDTVFHIALLSDTHYHFNALADAIQHINSNKKVAFVIVTGDLTENGLQEEYELFHSLMARSRKPYLTVIGNHDYLSNGGKVYEQMFGPVNYSFTFGPARIVMWDNVLWESNKNPDWTWFKDHLKSSEGNETGGNDVHHVIPFSHIPPFDGQLVDSASVFHDLLNQHEVKISIHGHKHEYSNAELYGNGIRYVTVGSPQKRAYAMLTVTPSHVSVEKINY